MSALASLTSKFRAASARERQLLVVAAIVVTAGALLSLADWAAAERQRLARALPAAEARLARMQAQAEELIRLRRAAPLPDASLAVRAEAARAAASARGLSLDVSAEAGALTISGNGSAMTVLDWLAAIQAEQGLRPVELELAPDADTLSVSGRLTADAADRSQ